MFKISKYVDSDKENVEIYPLEIEINDKKSKTLAVEVNGCLGDDDYTFRFIFNDIEKIFNIEVNDEVCLNESYLFEGETMFTYNGVTDLDTTCDIDLFRIDNDNYEFNISFNAREYNGIISFEHDLKKYL